jgi:hypothetical protein
MLAIALEPFALAEIATELKEMMYTTYYVDASSTGRISTAK